MQFRLSTKQKSSFVEGFFMVVFVQRQKHRNKSDDFFGAMSSVANLSTRELIGKKKFEQSLKRCRVGK